MNAATLKHGTDGQGFGRKNSPDIGAELSKAVAFHQNGRLAAAERLYLNVLECEPEQPDALHLLGVLALQKEDHDEAQNMICRAIRIAPGNAFYHNNLGAVYKGRGGLAKALECYETAIRLKPDRSLLLSRVRSALSRRARSDWRMVARAG